MIFFLIKNLVLLIFKPSREPSRESEESSNSTEPNRLLADFVGGLGPGQVAGRQALGAGSLGEVKLQIQVALIVLTAFIH